MTDVEYQTRFRRLFDVHFFAMSPKLGAAVSASRLNRSRPRLMNWFSPKRDDQKYEQLIQQFSSASQAQYHYENGKQV